MDRKALKELSAEQDSKRQSVDIKLEIDVCYGIRIPEKAEEIQHKVSEDITRFTGITCFICPCDF